MSGVENGHLLRAAGEPVRRRVLLLHGLGGTGQIWRPFLERADAATEYRGAELPWARGEVDGWADDPDVGQWVEQAIRAAEHAAGAPMDVVVAHSLAALALLDVLTRPAAGSPRAVVLVAPFYRPRVADFDWEGLAHSLENFHLLLEQGIVAQSPRPVSAKLRRELALRLRAKVGWRGWVRFSELYSRTPGMSVDRVTVPLLAVGGEADPASRPADSRRLAEAVPCGRARILAGAGHFPMVEQADEFAATVQAFLDDALTTPLRRH